MSDTVITKSKRKSGADYQAQATQLLAEMSLLEEQMDKTCAESERLKTETQIIKAETDIIKAHTTATLSQMMQQIHNLARTV